MRILFTHSEYFRSRFNLILRSPSSQNLFILSFQLSFLKSYRCIIPIFSKLLVIYSFSCIKFSLVSSFIFLFFPVFRYLFFIRFQFLRWFVQGFSSFVIISIYSLFQSHRWFHQDLIQVCVLSLLILSTRISSMPNPLLVINLNW